MSPSVPKHEHAEYWTEREHERFEDRVANQLAGLRGDLRSEITDLRSDVKDLNRRVTMLLGGVAAVAFLIPLLAPFLRGLLGFPQ